MANESVGQAKMGIDGMDSGRPSPRPAKSGWTRDKKVAFLVFLPSILVMLALGLYPVLRVLGYSLFDIDVFLNNDGFVGLENIIRVLTWDNFWNAVKNDLVFTLSSVVIQTVLGVMIALLLNQSFFGRGVTRSIINFSYLMPIVVAMLIWRFMLNDLVGVVNYFIEAWNLPIPTTWFGAVSTAMPTVIMVNVWKFFPFMVLVYLAQLQSIDTTLYEAAEVDGATTWQSFWYITFPSLLPVILVAAMLRTIWHFNDFTVVQLLTGGGPLASTETPPILIYDLVFAGWNLGRGSAVAVIMFVFLIAASLVYVRLFNWSQERLS